MSDFRKFSSAILIVLMSSNQYKMVTLAATCGHVNEPIRHDSAQCAKDFLRCEDDGAGGYNEVAVKCSSIQSQITAPKHWDLVFDPSPIDETYPCVDRKLRPECHAKLPYSYFQKDSTGRRYYNYANGYLKAIKLNAGEDHKRCIHECYRIKSCMAFNYRPARGLCELTDQGRLFDYDKSWPWNSNGAWKWQTGGGDRWYYTDSTTEFWGRLF